MILINASDETENFLKEAKKQTLDVHIVNGKMVNISANGFAFATRAAEIKNLKNTMVAVRVNEFPVLDGKDLVGYIIRISDHDGQYIVGCRMLEDNMDIYNYVEKHLRK